MGSEKGRKIQADPTHTKSQNTPRTPVEPAARRTAYTRAAATTTKARRRIERTESPSSFASSVKPRRARNFRDWDSQITLTQIVPQTESVNEDADLLEYDGDEGDSSRKADIEIIDLVDDSDDDDDDDTEYKPSTNRRTSSTKKSRNHRSPDSIPSTTFKSRKSVGFDSSAKKTTGWGRNKNDKKLKKGKDGNKTLTQMDFVRRYIPLPESDDDLVSYDEPSVPTNNESSENSKENKEQNDGNDGEFTPRKRRKLNDDSTVVSPKSPTLKRSPDRNTLKASPTTKTTPKTPQKLQKFEIPSSQTPETPHHELLASPDLHNVPRLPLEALSSNTSKLEQDKSPEKLHKSQTQPSLLSRSTIPETAENSVDQYSNSAKGPHVEPLEQATASGLDSLFSKSQEIQQPSDPPQPFPSTFDKTVVYETDAETDYGEFDDDDDDNLPRASSQMDDITPKVNHAKNYEEDRSIPNSDDSNDLPPHVPNSGTDLEINNNTLSDTALHSDASLYYRRPAQYTQYPTEPVPMLNTQKMAELFPTQDAVGERHAMAKTPPSTEKFMSPSKNQHFDQTQSDEAEKSTQMVPESSPVARNQEMRTIDDTMPPPQESVVLVESSQPVDRISRQNSSVDPGPALRRLLSAGDFLTDSVMESIPPPPWALSQDSVGEPYPERKCT